VLLKEEPSLIKSINENIYLGVKMSEKKKHFFPVAKNIKKMTEEELSEYADELYLQILDAFEKDDRRKSKNG
jgi:hypothetical protein